jgi:class 3 adenylate cyclase
MQQSFKELCQSLSMTEIIRLQTMLSEALIRRFEKPMALAFSDLVDSTPYFQMFGNEAGLRLQRRHTDLLQQALAGSRGRLVDTAGDGAFLCFPEVDEAATSMVQLLELISTYNAGRARQDQLTIRIGIHYGPVLSDGVLVTGEAVNFCSRLTSSGSAGEIRLTKEAFLAFTDVQHRLKCRTLAPTTLKGIEHPVELMVLDWLDRTAFPSSVRIETGEEYILPEQDVIRFGRLKAKNGLLANDIVLQCPDETRTLQISRWHFELRRERGGYVIRVLTNAYTSLNGRALSRGEECPIRPGDSVRVGGVLSLQFQAPLLQSEWKELDKTCQIQASNPGTDNAPQQSPRVRHARNPDSLEAASSPDSHSKDGRKR